MAAEKVSVSFQEEILREIDKVANNWVASRSQTLTRIFLEWKQHQQQTRPELTKQATK